MQLRTSLRAARTFARYQLGAVDNVLAASLMVTRRCTLRCGYCDRHTPRNAELDTATWLRLLDELADLGCAQVTFTGGEPLLRDDLAVLLRRARQRHMTVKLNTNGMLVARRPEVVRLAHAVTLSVDGPRAAHDRSRGVGAFDHAMVAARQVQAMGLPVRFYTVLSRDNVGELGALLDTAEEMGVIVFFQPGTATVLGSEGEPNPLAPAPTAYRAAIDQLISWRSAGRPVGNSAAALRYLRAWPDQAPPHCAWRSFVRIEEDGNLRTCGRDTQRERVDAAALGLARALAMRPAPLCGACWTAARVELHLLAQGEPSAWWELFRSDRAERG